MFKDLYLSGLTIKDQRYCLVDSAFIVYLNVSKEEVDLFVGAGLSCAVVKAIIEYEYRKLPVVKNAALIYKAMAKNNYIIDYWIDAHQDYFKLYFDSEKFDKYYKCIRRLTKDI